MIEFDFSKHELVYAREEGDGMVYATYRPVGYKGKLANADQIKQTVDTLFKTNPDKVSQAKKNPDLIGWFVGHTLKAFAGRAETELVRTLCREALVTH